MKHTYLKSIVLLLLLCFTLTLLPSCSLSPYMSLAQTPVEEDDAEQAETPSLPEPDYIDWQVAKDGDVIYAGDMVYEIAPYLNMFIIDPLRKYCYYDTVDIPVVNYTNAEVCSYERNGDILWVYGDEGYGRTYVNEEGLDSLMDFLTGDVPIYHLMESGKRRAYMDEALVDALETIRQKGGVFLKTDASYLKGLPCYTIAAYDASESLRFDFGAIYLYEGAYYYLNYLELDNSHFDADGYFSYRSGEVILAPLDEETTEALERNIDEIETFYIDYTYEEFSSAAGETTADPDDFSDILLPENTAGLVLFWITYAFIGFLCPIPFLVLGLVLPRRKKLGYPRYWYSIAIISGVWILLSIALMILLL